MALDTSVRTPEVVQVSPRARKGVQRAWILAIASITATAVLVTVIDLDSRAGRIAYSLLPLLGLVPLTVRSRRLSRTASGAMGGFWRRVALAGALFIVGQIARTIAVEAGAPDTTADLVAGVLNLSGIVVLGFAFIKRLKAVVGDGWQVQLVDAGLVAVIIWTLVLAPLAGRTVHATTPGIEIQVLQPAVVLVLGIGLIAILLAPIGWHHKRVEIVLAVATFLGVCQTWIDVFTLMSTPDTTSPLAGLLLVSTWVICSVAPEYEDPAWTPPTLHSYGPNVLAWPYLAMIALPVIVLWAILSGGDATIGTVAVGCVIVFALAVIRQIEVLRSQRTLLQREIELTKRTDTDVATARALLAAARDLASSTTVAEADAAVINAALRATAADRIEVRTTPPEDNHHAESTVVIKAGQRHDPALLVAWGATWHPTEVERGVLVGLGRQLAVARQRASLFADVATTERRYGDVVENLPSAILEVGRDGVIVHANAAFSRLTGIADHDLIGAAIDDLVVWVDPEPAEARRRAAAGAPVDGEATVVCADGTRRPAEVSLRLVAADGRATGHQLAVIRDISGQRDRRRRIARLYQQIQAKDQARTELLESVVSSAEDERRRLAGEIHDGPVQTLTALGLRLDALIAAGDGGAAGLDTQAEVAVVRSEITSTGMLLREHLGGLQPLKFETGGLGNAVLELCRRTEWISGVRIVADVDSMLRLPEPLEVVLYRVAQEALQNVVRHADAGSARVFLGTRDGSLALEVRDDGQGGFEIGPGAIDRLTASGHFGIASMAERILLAGGRFEVGPSHDGGTRLLATLPVEALL